MAITWSVEITVLDVAKKAVSVVATRTDSADPTTAQAYNVLYALIATPAARVGVLDNLWAQHQARITRRAQIDALVGSLEADAKANLEAREV